jgi:hypothetical protein
MHVVAINVTLNDPEDAREYLQSSIVPNVQQAPGFVAGYWYGDETQRKGASTIVFDSEENATALMNMIREQEGPGHATIDSIEVLEVVANA